MGLFSVGRLKTLNVAGYTRADARAEFKITQELAVIAIGQNLLEPSHWEFSDFQSALVGSRVPRRGQVQLRWRF
jgi:hypothetical protein